MDSSPAQTQGSAAVRSGPLVNIVTWLLLVISILALLSRLFSKRSINKPLGPDDALVGVALVLSAASAAATSLQVSNGLGQTAKSLGDDELARFFKSHYATEMIYLAVLCSARLSIVSLLLAISRARVHRMMTLATTILIGLCWVTSELAVAFQCSLPRPWDPLSNACLNRIGLWYYIGITSLLSDLMLIFVPVFIIQALQLKTKKKLLILASFSARILDLAATTAQLAITPSLASRDPPQELWSWTLILQVVQCVTIVTSCLPYLRQLLEMIPSGMYTSDDHLRRRGRAGGGGGYGGGGCWNSLTPSVSTASNVHFGILSRDRRGGADPEAEPGFGVGRSLAIEFGFNKSSRHPTPMGKGPLLDFNHIVALNKITSSGNAQCSTIITGAASALPVPLAPVWDAAGFGFDSQAHILKTTSFNAESGKA